MKLAVIKTGGKQYLVKKNDELFVDRLPLKKGDKVKLDTLAVIENEKEDVNLGTPILENKTEAELLDHIKADKIRVAKFKAKVRYRRVRGYRHSLSKIKITKI